MKRLAPFLAVLLGGLLALELGCRWQHDALFDAGHRALFKLALLRTRPPPDVLFFGTSRAGEALRPPAFLAGLPGHELQTAFNVSAQYSSFEILDDVTARALGNDTKLAVIEVSRHAVQHHPLEWTPHPLAQTERAPLTPQSEDFDAWMFSALEEHLRLVSLRKSFVLDCFARFLGVLLVGRAFDGSEQMGTDYARSLFGARPLDLSLQAPGAQPVVHQGGPSSGRSEEAWYARMCERFRHQGTKVVFFVPPTQGGQGQEASEEFQALVRGVSNAAPVVDFSSLHFADADFRDPTHMSHQGGARLSRVFAARFLELAR